MKKILLLILLTALTLFAKNFDEFFDNVKITNNNGISAYYHTKGKHKNEINFAKLVKNEKAIEAMLFRGTETFEYPADWKPGDTPYYPVNNDRNTELYNKYKSLKNDKVVFVGRLGQYKYYDMDDTIEKALNMEL